MVCVVAESLKEEEVEVVEEEEVEKEVVWKEVERNAQWQVMAID